MRASSRRRRWSFEHGRPLRHRHRPGHHAQRARLGRPARRRRRRRRHAPRRARDSPVDRARQRRAAEPAALVPLPAARRRVARRGHRTAVGCSRGRACHRRRVRSQPWCDDADPAGLQCQELAVPRGRRPPCGHPAQRRTRRGAARLAARRIGALPGSPARRVEPRAPRGPLRRAECHRHHSGVVRPRCARADRRGRPHRWLRQPHAAGGTSGRALQLDPAERRCLAQVGLAG